MKKYHPQGNSKLEAEEVLYEQRLNGGFPFVILRLPDVVGPRDNTGRWWVYHLWVRLSLEDPTRFVKTPEFLQDYKISFVYNEDVATLIANITDLGPQIEDQAINLAYPDPFYLDQIIRDIKSSLGLNSTEDDDASTTEETLSDDRDDEEIPSLDEVLYLYPSVRSGPLDVSKVSVLNPLKTDNILLCYYFLNILACYI